MFVSPFLDNHAQDLKIQNIVLSAFKSLQIKNRVAPESWDPLCTCAFGIFFQCQTMAKITEIAVFWKRSVIFEQIKYPKIGGFWAPKLGPL